METRLVAALVAVPLALVLPGCAGRPQMSVADASFVSAVEELEVPVDPTDVEVQRVAAVTCDQLVEGVDLERVYSNLDDYFGLSTDEARSFTAASAYAYCPRAI